MSGVRSYPFREGDRSEYLASYLLSGIGLVTSVPRQEDIGFDFYCQLSDNEEGSLTFGYPFIVQIKSNNSDIVYGSNSHEKWNENSLKWLFRLELPLFIGVVDKKKMQISIYNTTALNFIFFENPNPTAIKLITRKNHEDSNTVGRPLATIIEDWPYGKGDGFMYDVDLGKPIITIDNDDIYNVNDIKSKKGILRKIINVEMQNLLNRKLNLNHFKWIHDNHTNQEYIRLGWIYEREGDIKSNIEKMYKSLAPSIIALAFNLELYDKETLDSIKLLLSKLPDESKYPEMRALLKDYIG